MIGEAMIGRAVELLPSMSPAICGEEPWSHVTASVMALEDILGRTPTIPAIGLRRLGLLLEIIENHVRNLAFRTLPWLGYIEHGRAWEIMKHTMKVSEILGGRSRNPVTIIAGGASWRPGDKDLEELGREAETIHELVVEYVDGLWGRLKGDDRLGKLLALKPRPTAYAAVIGEDDAPGILGGDLILLGSEGRAYKTTPGKLIENLETGESSGYLWTMLHRSLGVLRTGPLARFNVSRGYIGGKASELYEELLAMTGGKPVHNPYYNVFIRLIEAASFSEILRDALSDVDWLKGSLSNYKGSRRNEGYGVIDSPRGLVIHHYRVDEDLMVRRLELITSSHLILPGIHVDLGLFKGLSAGGETMNHVNLLISSYDPCIPGATIKPGIEAGGGS